jgi:Polysaccharide biosynthesis
VDLSADLPAEEVSVARPSTPITFSTRSGRHFNFSGHLHKTQGSPGRCEDVRLMKRERSPIRKSGERQAQRALAAVLPRIPESARRHLVRALRFTYGFQISAKALVAARNHLGNGGRLLVFGVGLDSSTWELVNRGGRTVFLEDVPGWIDISGEEAPDREVHLIAYETTVTGSLHYEDRSEIPLPTLPGELALTQWDVVVVDGPYGWGPETPGRSASIALAQRLVAPGGIVLIDDYDRALERHSCDIVFGRPADEMLDTTRPVALFRC